jgi:hypothetical protein
MKNIYSYCFALFVTVVAMASVLVSCSEDEDGQPMISNVRVVQKDSTIAAGEFNLTIAIQGSNLGEVNKVMFNDLTAYINPVYVTNSNILVAIPDDAPNEINNKITVFTKSGKSATFDFQVILPEPVVTGVYNEFASPGDENKVLGTYFYVISKVLVGETEVEIIKITDTEISFIMPADPVGKTVTVIGEGGTTTSTFRLHETEGNMINFDIPATGWGSDVCWGDSERINPDDSELPVISGRYARIKQSNLAATGYQGDWVFSTCWFEFGLAPGSHTDKMFKLEANIVEPWKAGYYVIRIGTEDGSLFIYKFKPWDTEQFRDKGIKTIGWKTFYIPLSEFRKTLDEGVTFVDPAVGIADISKIRDLRVDFNNSGDDAEPITTHYVALDNLRIVDK